MIRIVTDRALDESRRDAIACCQQSMANSIEKWICAEEKPEAMNDYPEIERLFVRYKIVEACARYRECLENRLLCLCLKYGNLVRFKDEDIFDENGNPVVMVYENAIIFSEPLMMEKKSLYGVFYSPDMDKNDLGCGSWKLDNGIHPGLCAILSDRCLMGDEVENIRIFREIESLMAVIARIRDELAQNV